MTILATYTRTWVPLFTQHAIDSILQGLDSQLPQFFVDFINLGGSGIGRQLLFTGIALVALMVVRGFMMFLRQQQTVVFSEKISNDMRDKLFTHIQDLSFSYHSNAETGDLIQRATSDIDTVRRFISSQFMELTRGIFLFIFILIKMLELNVMLTLISLVILPITFGFAMFFFKKVQVIFKETDESEGRMSNVVQENLTGIQVVKAFGNESYEVEKFEKVSKEFADNVDKIIRWMAYYWSISDWLSFTQIIITILVGTYLSISGTITTGILIVFVSYIQIIVWPIRQMGRIIVDLSKSGVALRRIEEVLSEKDEYVADGKLEPVIEGQIEFKDVSFQFEDSTYPTLKNIDLKINHGETLAIVGTTGSGKTTLMNLLIRLLDHTSGEILIDGTPIQDIRKHHLRENVGIILQEPFLFSKTIKENIGITTDDSSDDPIFEAAKIASIHDDIQAFEKGYETIVGERGVTLSGGQKQRVAIARMLVKEKPIVVFDDSLSAVDTETDLQIRNALKARDKKNTNIIITHRITTAMEADRIIVIDDGSIKEAGTHEQLIDLNGLYKNMWDIQIELKSHFIDMA
jgi:ATP-binding cassette subfamily B protein